MEEVLGMEGSEVETRINTGRFGPRLITAMFFGATRKFHRREFPTLEEVDDLFDRMDDECEDLEEASEKLFLALLAAYNRSSVSETEERLFGEEYRKEGGGAPKDGRKPKKAPSGSGS